MRRLSFLLFFFNDTATTEIYTLSLHDALPISTSARPTGRSVSSPGPPPPCSPCAPTGSTPLCGPRSEEHTSELQSQSNLVCRLLLEKKKNRERPPDQFHIYPPLLAFAPRRMPA